jgi:hypothetical protein
MDEKISTDASKPEIVEEEVTPGPAGGFLGCHCGEAQGRSFSAYELFKVFDARHKPTARLRLYLAYIESPGHRLPS